MSQRTDYIKKGMENSFSYKEYSQLVEDLLKEGKSTTKDAGEMAAGFVEYSKLGLQRMKRWDKRFKLSSPQEEDIKKYDKKVIWLVLTEGWCGDAAHSVPVINKVAEANDFIDLRLVLREENPELMNVFLTNGGKSIPKLIAFDPEKEKVLGTWGPRPEPAQKIFLEARKNDVDFDTYEKDLQQWYNKDKGQTALAELMELLK